YRCSVAVAKARLDVLGFTSALAQREFDGWVQKQLTSVDEALDPSNENFYEPLREVYESRRKVLATLDFRGWVDALKSLASRGIDSTHSEGAVLNEAETFILNDDDTLFGYPLIDLRLFLRAALEAFSESEPLEL